MDSENKMLAECKIRGMSTYDHRCTRPPRRTEQGTGSDPCYWSSGDGRVVSTPERDSGDKDRRTQSYWDRQTTVVCWADAHKEHIERSPMARITCEVHPRLAGNMIDG